MALRSCQLNASVGVVLRWIQDFEFQFLMGPEMWGCGALDSGFGGA